MDVSYRDGNVPIWWQLLKNLSEEGHDIIEISYMGKSIETLWWRKYDNPCERSSIIARKIQKRMRNTRPKKKVFEKTNINNFRDDILESITKIYSIPKWEKKISEVFRKEKNIDYVFFMSVPINQIHGLGEYIRKEYSVPTIYLEYDMPVRLPKYVKERGIIDYFKNLNHNDYSAFVVNSTGSIDEMKKLGVNQVYALHEAADPDLFSPVKIEKKYDVAFYAHGDQQRKKWMKRMITNPSLQLNNYEFVVGGKDITMDLGSSTRFGVIPLNKFKYFCSASKINLNISRSPFCEVQMSSTARTFELPAMGCSVVSNPAEGLDKWFKHEKEMYILSEDEEISDIYSWLLDDDNLRNEMGINARKRVINEHTYKHRAAELTKIMGKIK
jgi:glycosyltransferase involved in cell wall biosynthesis